MTVRINNCSPAELVLPKNSIIGFFEPVNSATIQELENDTFINAVNKSLLIFLLCSQFLIKNNF